VRLDRRGRQGCSSQTRISSFPRLPAATSKVNATASAASACSRHPLSSRKMPLPAYAPRWFPSTKGWLMQSDSKSAAAFSNRVGYSD